MRRSAQTVVAAMILLFGLGAMAGCSTLKLTVARLQPRDQFQSAIANPDVHYRPGLQALADRIAAALPNSTAIIERTHGAKFRQPPRIFICHTDCFTSFTAAGNEIPATMIDDAVFMNVEVLMQREQQRGTPVEDFLTHELAHLLLFQRAGRMAFGRVPAWFKEGVAVSVTQGAGIETCTPAEAAKSILAGMSFDPAERGSLFRNRTAGSYGLGPSMFYRQAGLFVQYLRERNPMAFQAALTDTLNGEDFQESFGRAYGQSLSSQWPDFITSMSQLAVQR